MKKTFFYVVFLLVVTITTSCVLLNPVYDNLKLSASEVTVEEGDKAAFEIISGSGDYLITVVDTRIGVATLSGTTVVIKGIKEGKSSIIVFDKNTDERAVVEINITKLIPRMTFTTTESIGKMFTLGLLGSEYNGGELPNNVWIDINNNGMKEKGEDLSEIQREYEHNLGYVLVNYPRTHIYAFKLLSQTVTIYGDVAHLDFLNLGEVTKPYYEKDYPNMHSGSEYKKNPTKLTSLEVKKNKKLEVLRCGLTGISTLDVRGMRLSLLDCSKNNLKSLDVGGSSISVLRCSDNQLTSLKLGYVERLNCENNQLADLGNLELVKRLLCANNQLTTLAFKGGSIEYLDCTENRINAEAMANLVNSLPFGKIEYERVGLDGLLYPIQNIIITNSNSPTEKNQITPENIAALKKKQWKVGWTDHTDNGKFKEY
ncbi:hypothetical protein CGC58_02015 [Capnocytophaga stomatis]|uniref:Uncharacterized protein n=1 Tax=Capnocytophaga stomatis TaxID=1848904 RepID=A0A250FXA0_9FLAO|nr:hypothetical protein [Capnocytophaga stomatis]ATA88616.1 hypothetical protein CGC58_02015 [Capnocytophaga stomatis]